MNDRGDEAKIIDGKAIAAAVLEETAREARSFSEGFRPPRLTVVIVGDDPASRSYVRGKTKSAAAAGIDSDLVELSVDTEAAELLDIVDRLNADPAIDGILVQLPLPGGIDQQEVIERIDPRKDVDGFHPWNLGRLVSGHDGFVPCTPLGISEMLVRHGVETSGRRVVVIGRSVIVGKPLALLLARKDPRGDATVTLCHSRSENLAGIAREADILVAAIGRANTVGADWVKEGAVVIDVGVNRVPDDTRKKGYRLSGDVDFDAVLPRASLITPVPGGVGPMTRAMLMRNTLLAAVRARG